MNSLTEPCGGFVIFLIVIHESTQRLLLTTVANMTRSLPLSVDLHFLLFLPNSSLLIVLFKLYSLLVRLFNSSLLMLRTNFEQSPLSCINNEKLQIYTNNFIPTQQASEYQDSIAYCVTHQRLK